jgi:hypothetical protein
MLTRLLLLIPRGFCRMIISFYRVADGDAVREGVDVVKVARVLAGAEHLGRKDENSNFISRN